MNVLKISRRTVAKVAPGLESVSRVLKSGSTMKVSVRSCKSNLSASSKYLLLACRVICCLQPVCSCWLWVKFLGKMIILVVIVVLTQVLFQLPMLSASSLQDKGNGNLAHTLCLCFKVNCFEQIFAIHLIFDISPQDAYWTSSIASG